MKLKLAVIFAVGAIAMGLMLGATTARAEEEVIFDQNDATRAVEIRNLDIDGTLYNVTFSETDTTAAQVYGPFPGTFDFDTKEGAEDAVIAVIAALQNAGAYTVGVEGSSELNAFRVGFGSETIIFGLQAVIFWEGGRGDGDLQAEPWVKPPQPDVDSYPGGVRLWALFALASEPPDDSVTIGGSVAGLVGSGLVLQNNGTDDETISGNGDFTFGTPLTPGSTYNVTVSVDPSNPDQTCSVANGSGTVPSQAVTNVAVTCEPPDTPVVNTAYLPAITLLLSE